MTFKEKYIYNCYLETSRKLNNKPFKYRQNFDEFETTEDYIYVNKLNRLFSKFENINIKDFFEAPYFVFNEKYFDLKFFTTQKAIKAYTLYQNNFLPENPDHQQSIEKIKSGFAFIYKFCKQNNIKLDEYATFVAQDNKIHSFMEHLKNRDISLYNMFVFPNFDKSLKQYDNDIKNFMFGESLQNINFYRTKYYGSSKAKNICTLAYTKLISLNS